MKKLLAILLAIFMVASVFTACGDEKKSDSSDDKKTESTAGDNNGGTNNGGTNNGDTNNGGLGGLGGLGGNNGDTNNGDANNGGTNNGGLGGLGGNNGDTNNGGDTQVSTTPDSGNTNNGGDADGSYDSALIGTWTTTIEEDGESLYMTWNIKNGGTLTITVAYDGETESAEVDWYTSDGVIFATNENETFELKYTVNGATLEVEEDGEIVTFHKV